jgi:hypothetical protein
MLRTASALRTAGGMIPKHLRSEGEILAVIMAGQELGLPPMAALRGLYLVHGKVGLSYDAMVGLLRRAGYRIQWQESTPTRAVLELTHPDGSTHTETWDVERAKTAGLWGSATWRKYPDTMLRARCVSSAARAFAGDVLAGCYSVDEVREISDGRVTGHDEGGDITVTVVDDRGANADHHYGNPEHDEAKERAVAIAEGFVAEVLPGLEECIAEAAAEMQDAADREADEAELEAIRNGHYNALCEWVQNHGPRYIEVCSAHPACGNAKSKVYRRLVNWCKEVGISESTPREALAELVAKQDAA